MYFYISSSGTCKIPFAHALQCFRLSGCFPKDSIFTLCLIPQFEQDPWLRLCAWFHDKEHDALAKENAIGLINPAVTCQVLVDHRRVECGMNWYPRDERLVLGKALGEPLTSYVLQMCNSSHPLVNIFFPLNSFLHEVFLFNLNFGSWLYPSVHNLADFFIFFPIFVLSPLAQQFVWSVRVMTPHCATSSFYLC